MKVEAYTGRVFAALTACALLTQLAACTSFPLLQRRDGALPARGQHASSRQDDGNGSGDDGSRPRVKETVPEAPAVARPREAASLAVWRRALAARGTRIVVSTEHRALWLMRDSTTLFSAPVAVGMHEGFTYRNRRYDFRTPVGQRKVLAKAPDPIWTPPDWHYFEKVVQRNLIPVELEPGSRVPLADGSRIEVRGDQVGRVNQFGNFAPFTPGLEIIFDGKIFIPPFGTAQRRIPEILGTHKLEMGDGYLIHGTPEEHTIGEAVSHGCVRMYNEDVVRLYEMIPIGTAIFIY